MTTIIFPDGPARPKDTTTGHTFGLVYANDVAFEDMMRKPPQAFRTGAIIVREKLSDQDSQNPKVLAVMIKRAPGFNPPAHDWEFLVTNGAATKIRQRKKQGDCFGCHQSQPDFVYGVYDRKP